MKSQKGLPSPHAPTILVADRESEAARLLARYLSRQGLRASHTGSGQDVLFSARSGSLALAILDAELEDMSGQALACRLKEIDARIHVVMTSADPRPELEIQARQAGVLYYAHKPINHRSLKAVVERALNKDPCR